MGNTKAKNNSNKPKQNAKTVTSVKKQNTVEYVIVNILCLFVFIAFAYIAIMSFVQTSVFDSANYGSEIILYQTDNIALNILFTSLFTVFIFKMKKHCDFFAKVNLKYMHIGLAAFVMIVGLVWIFSVTSVPAADSYNIYETASQAAKGNYSSFHNNSGFYNSDFYSGYSYYNFYPFQLGFVFISEIFYRIFGTDSTMPIQVFNVMCTAAAYIGIVNITRLLFKKRSVEFITILLLAGCFQPVLFCTFVYGNIIGMCFAIWASYFLIKYFQTNKYLLLIPCAVLLVISTLAKYNNLIYLVAFVVMLIIHTIKAKKWQSIAFALAIC
ncbi:MAG: glycosyltransferase family 39 protein, partial [Ruminococcus bromii]